MRRACILAVLAVMLGGCRALHYEQAGLQYNFARVKLPSRGDFSISAGSITSTRGPITRVVYRVGKDLNGDGKLDPQNDQLSTNIDNPNPSPQVAIGAVSGNIGRGETWIAELHVWHGGNEPVISQSWTNKP